MISEFWVAGPINSDHTDIGGHKHNVIIMVVTFGFIFRAESHKIFQGLYSRLAPSGLLGTPVGLLYGVSL